MIDNQIREVLGTIHDPCSIAAGRPISILDMGLVRGWTLEDGVLEVTFCVTFAGCTMAPHFAQNAANDLARLPDIERVDTHIDTEFVWTPDLSTGPRPQMTGRPQQWRERVTP